MVVSRNTKGPHEASLPGDNKVDAGRGGSLVGLRKRLHGRFHLSRRLGDRLYDGTQSNRYRPKLAGVIFAVEPRRCQDYSVVFITRDLEPGARNCVTGRPDCDCRVAAASAIKVNREPGTWGCLDPCPDAGDFRLCQAVRGTADRSGRGCVRNFFGH